MLARGILAKTQLPTKKDGLDKKCNFWVKIGSVRKIWPFNRPERPTKKSVTWKEKIDAAVMASSVFALENKVIYRPNMSEIIFIKMMKNDVFQKALKSIWKHSRSDSGMPGHHFWRFPAEKTTKMRNLRIFKFQPQNAGKWEKWGVENQIFSANAEKLLNQALVFPALAIRRRYLHHRFVIKVDQIR